MLSTSGAEFHLLGAAHFRLSVVHRTRPFNGAGCFAVWTVHIRPLERIGHQQVKVSFNMSTMFNLDTVPVDDRHRVAALIPDPRIADAYVHRIIKGVEDFALFDGAVEDMENVLLAGPTGSSKTTAFRAYAAARGLPFALVESNAAMDPGVIVGRTTVVNAGEIRWVDGDMTLVVRYGGVVLIDEINMTHQRIMAAWHQLLAITRRMSIPENGETVIAGRGGVGDPQPTLFAAAYNPRYQGTVRLNEALANRFAVPLDWGYERDVEAALVTSARLLDVAENIRSLGEIRSPLSTNMLMEYERHVGRYGMELATYLLANHFADDEQGPVNRAMEANSAAIAAELSVGADG